MDEYNFEFVRLAGYWQINVWKGYEVVATMDARRSIEELRLAIKDWEKENR